MVVSHQLLSNGISRPYPAAEMTHYHYFMASSSEDSSRSRWPQCPRRGSTNSISQWGLFLNHYLCPPQVGKGPLWASYSQALVDHLLPKSNDTAMTSELTQVRNFSDMTQIPIGYFSLSQISSDTYIQL